MIWLMNLNAFLNVYTTAEFVTSVLTWLLSIVVSFDVYCNFPHNMSACSARERIKATTSSPRKFTWQELSSLNERHNAHVAVRGKVGCSLYFGEACPSSADRWRTCSCYDSAQVYDVSSFVSRHPGGADQILLGAGRDVTQLFESYHSSETPNRLVRSLLTRVKACSRTQRDLDYHSLINTICM